MSNRLKVYFPMIVVVTILIIAFLATPSLLPQDATPAGKGSPSMSSEDLMAYLQWKHNYLNNNNLSDSETQRILDYHRWKDAIESSVAPVTNERDQLMAYLQWKHISESDVDLKSIETAKLLNYLQWKHNLPSVDEPTSFETERLIKYLAWKHMQDPGK